MDVPVRCGRAHALGELLQQMRRAVVQDRVHGVQPQAVEVELLDPVERVVDEELADRPGVLAPSKLIAAPHGVWCRSVKVCGAMAWI